MGPALHLTPAVIIAIGALALGQSDMSGLQEKLPGLKDLQSQLNMGSMNIGASGGIMQDMQSKIMGALGSMVPSSLSSSFGGQFSQESFGMGGMRGAGIMQSLGSVSGAAYSDSGTFDALATGLATTYEAASDAGTSAAGSVSSSRPSTAFIF